VTDDGPIGSVSVVQVAVPVLTGRVAQSVSGVLPVLKLTVPPDGATVAGLFGAIVAVNVTGWCQSVVASFEVTLVSVSAFVTVWSRGGRDVLPVTSVVPV
jgi:hypothetical protein